ncbi:MAG TPA: sugar phosphate isomerase/epimerase family protein [Caldilineaceae bacterium]|nr:sugar phosphate isomerase/epimerase family protein [Caldilineaceae bacterium]
MYPNLSAGAIGVRASLPDTIAYAQANGFRGIDFSIGEAAELAQTKGVGWVKQLFDEAGVLPAVMGFPVEYRKDEATWRAGLEALPAQAKLAAELGCTRTATWLIPGSDERDFLENFRFHVARLGPAAQILADHGIRLGLEFIGPKTLRSRFKYRFIYTLEGMLALAAAMNTGTVGLLLDIWHLYTSHGSNDQVRELRNEDVVVVHINDAPAGVPVDEQIDNVRALPGETGVLDIAGFLQALQAIGYDGPVTAEPFSQRVREMAPDEAVRATAASVRKVWQAAGLEW